MSMRQILIAATMLAALSGCATSPQGVRPVSKVAYITSGDNYFYGATRHAQEIAVVELDGKAVAATVDPLELQPGRHTLKMKCSENISTHTMTVRAGEIYQYLMRSSPGGKGCSAALSRVRSSN
jgi:hypothetical protein